MTFDELLTQVVELLQRQGRVSYGALKRRFALDDDYLQDLKDELIDAQRLALDEDGKVLVWIGASLVAGSPQPPAPQTSDSGLRTPDSKSQTLDSRLQTLDSSRPEAERRQLTVMFCDLVGSTALSERLDPEELREVVRAYQATCTNVVQHYEGHLAQHMGDGLLVYFGYPAAHEDDAQRAVHAGLEILAALPQLNRQLQPTVGATHASPLRVRIGIHTGLVVVGEIGGGTKREVLALGETPNLAARLQGLAEPDTVVISAATYRLSEGFFACRALGPQSLKGISVPVEVYHVLGESGIQSRFEVAVTTGLTPLVGREEESGLLWQRWERVKERAGQVVLLSGEPGIGKSRLVQVLKERVAQEGYTRIEFRCSPYYQNTAFYPVIEHVQRLLQLRRDDTPPEKLKKLERGLGEYGLSLEEVVPLFAAFLSLPHPEHYPPLTLSPQKQKQKTQEALVAWLLAEAERKAVLAAWEDLHWADPSTLELLSLFIEQAPTASLYLLLTCRPEFTPPWASRSHLTSLTLSRLPRTQAEEMVTQVTGGKALPAEVVQQVVAKTDGVPLFVEELTKMVLESGLVREQDGQYELTGPLPPLAIPATLQDSLMARLDRLATVKEVAQLGATLGREFSYELLQAVSPLDEATLQRELAQLVDAEFLYQRGLLPQSQYLFKHALIQDAAYQSLLKSTRQQYHRQIAQVLEERFAETREIQPELLAHHYTEAGLKEQAIPYWQRAGERATQRSAYVEAVAHLTRGLELLKTLLDTPERVQHELTLQLALSDAVLPVKGHAAPEMEKIVTRARELCQQLGETPQLFPMLWRLMVFYHNRGESQTALELSKQMMRLAQSIQDRLLLSVAHQALGCTLYVRGELTSARTHLEQAIALYDPQQHRRSIVATYFDPRVICRGYAAFTLWGLGYPDQGLEQSQEAVAVAEGLSHPHGLTEALFFAAAFHSLRREGQLAREQIEVAMTLSTEQGFPFWLAWGLIMRGGALAEQGQVEEGIAQMQQGLAAFRAMGAEWMRISFLPMLAAAYAKVGRVEEGLSVVAEVLAFVDKTGARVFEAGLYMLKGWLLLARSGENQAEAEGCFRQAIDIACRQSAKSVELQAVVSLSRLWQQQGKKEEAHEMLLEIYDWFTEGFDTKDLQEARALLQELT